VSWMPPVNRNRPNNERPDVLYTIRETLLAFKRAPLLTGLSAAMVGLALFVVGLFGLATHNVRLYLETLEERVEVVAYLRDNASTPDITAMAAAITMLPEVLAVDFVTKAEALEKAYTELPEFNEILSDLQVNPLPASIEIQLRPGNRTPATADRVAQQAALHPIVEEVQYGQEWVDKLFALRRMGAVTTTVMGTAFAIVAALIIGTAVRIAIFARREEIKIMQLVGARDSFVYRPFLLEGGITGALGGAIAVLLTYTTFWSVFNYLFTISWIPWEWAGIGMSVGIVFGVFASGYAVRKHLREV
jgi:cell division transport system permease protein